MQKQREVFFREFVKELIRHSAPLEIAPVHAIPRISARPEPVQQLAQQIKQQIQHSVPQRPMPPVPVYQIQATPLPITQQPALASLSKLNFLLADPSVFSIECTGPDRPILINKQGIIQTTNITLIKNEIDEIIKEFSEKTRIPLIQGTFKAVLGRILITAVVSEFIGTRFIIQKRMPPY